MYSIVSYLTRLYPLCAVVEYIDYLDYLDKYVYSVLKFFFPLSPYQTLPSLDEGMTYISLYTYKCIYEHFLSVFTHILFNFTLFNF